MQFRKEALERNRTQEVLDLPVRLTSPRGWIVVAVLTAAVVGVGVWGATASLPRGIGADGIITSARGSFTIRTAVAGRVTKVFARKGSTVEAGDRVVRLRADESEITLYAPAAGRVFSLEVQVGKIVQAGSTLVVAEYAGTAADEPVAVLYLPKSTSETVIPGYLVDLNLESVPETSFGMLRGRVTSVDSSASSLQDIADYLGDPDLAQALTAKGSVRRVVVALETSSATVSGYVWTTQTGPPFKITSRIAVQGRISLPPIRPVEWVMPK